MKVTTVAQAYVNWRIQADVIAATIKVQGKPVLSKELLSLLVALDDHWIEEFGTEYLSNLKTFFEDAGAHCPQIGSSMYVINGGGRS